jgi:hypothetical protein
MKPSAAFKRDYLGGALMTLIGLSAAYASLAYDIGTPAHMGPGFFPCAIGVLLAINGALIAIAATGQKEEEKPTAGHSHALPDLRGTVCIVLSVLAFIFCGHYLGLAPATFSIVFIAALGDRTNTVRAAVVLALVMSVAAAIIFWWALSLQMPLFKWGG